MKYKCKTEHTNCYEFDGYGGYYVTPFTIKEGMIAEVIGDSVYYPELNLHLEGKDAINLKYFEQYE